MTKEELEKEASKWLRKYLLCCNCEKKCICIDSNSYCEEQVLKAYVDSAEPREKRIAELRKEIEKLKKTYRKQRNKRIDNLQKENAELKDYRLTTLAKQQTDMSKYALNLEHKLSWYDDQLTKAKEHIKQLLDCLKQDTNDPQTNYYVCKYMDKAEQFLKE